MRTGENQLGHAQSLREIAGGLASCEGKLKHLGMDGAPARSTLAYANEHRPWQLYQDVFQTLLGRCQHEAQNHNASSDSSTNCCPSTPR